MPPKIVISPFCQKKDQPFCRVPLKNLIPEITENFGQAKEGYRKGVLLVPISPESFKGAVRTLQEGDKLIATFEARVPGEAPRKAIKVDSSIPDPIVAVDVVLYSRETLAEGNEGSDPSADFEVITVLTKISEDEQPMPPETLLSNHFGASGGTATHMSPAEFEEALCKSFNFWKDKAIIASRD